MGKKNKNKKGNDQTTDNQFQDCGGKNQTQDCHNTDSQDCTNK